MKDNGWGTWIRTRTDGVRVRRSTVNLFPSKTGSLNNRYNACNSDMVLRLQVATGVSQQACIFTQYEASATHRLAPGNGFARAVTTKADFFRIITRNQLYATIFAFAGNNTDMVAHDHDGTNTHWFGFLAIGGEITCAPAVTLLIASFFKDLIHIAGTPFTRTTAWSALAKVFFHKRYQVARLNRCRNCAKSQNKAERKHDFRN